MKQEEKQLLLKDLCARLPYGMKCDRLGQAKMLLYVSPYKVYCLEFDNSEYMLGEYKIEDIKPYLRPMSSMTKEEKYTYRHMLGATLNSEGESIMFVYVEDFPAVIDWLLAHYFDFRGLIEKGLALKAPKDMYKTE